MKKIVAIIISLAFAFTSFSQDFADTIELNQYIRDTIKDRRPDKINALQVQKALLGLSKFLGTASIDLNSLHADVRLNSDSTKYIYYNIHGDSIGSTAILHEDIYTEKGLLQRDSTAGSIILSAGRLDSTWTSADSIWEHFLYMSGAHDSVQRIVGDGSGGTTFDTTGIVRSTSTFPPTAIPFANSSGVLTHEVTALAYDAVNGYVVVGRNNAGVPSGFQINGNRGSIYADINGLLFQAGVSTTYDGTKHFRFRNGSVSAPYLELYSSGAVGGPYTHHADFTTNVSISQSLNVGVTAEYADNAAAITGGLSVGTIYRTGDLLKIVH